MTAIQEIHTMIQKRRNASWQEVSELTVSRALFDRAHYECRESMKNFAGLIPDIPKPGDFLLYGVRIMPDDAMTKETV